MRLPLIIQAISFLCLSVTDLALSVPLSKQGCNETCGSVTIPYPFGIGSNCSANSSFTVICKNSTNPPTPVLSGINLEVLEIFLQGTIIVNQPVSPLNCTDDLTQHDLPISLLGSPFTISARHNTLVNMGCHNSVWLRTNSTTVSGGCMALCDKKSTDTSCNGVNCCQTTISERLQKLNNTYKSDQQSNGSFCGYAFPVDKEWLRLGYIKHRGLQNDLENPFDKDFEFAPLVLEWEAYNLGGLSPNSSCSNTTSFLRLCNNPYIYSPNDPFIYSSDDPFIYDPYLSSSTALNMICRDPSYSSIVSSFTYYAHNYQSTRSFCHCKRGFEGNPYLPGGCTDINECSNATLIKSYCENGSSCVNVYGSFYCQYQYPRGGVQTGIAPIVIGSVIGALILLYGAWRSGNAIRKVIMAVRRYRFYKRNGGLLLEQHLASTENGLEKTKLFTSKELTHATDRYNENRILGRGGQGTVYKGMLIDGNIVAVKKSKKVDEGDLEVFINEVVILSQINHRNIVRLLGCCLETEVPLLVYEFVPNGTLFQHIHEPNEGLPLTWEMRVRIATEVAGALAYLHSASSAPIYHRDIKSTNILLDHKYRAKISDFGTSRSVAIDQTHVTTRVLGTFGYLDPEYFQSSQYTEKSDVYSFGVVMVELLTGEKAISSVRSESGKSLATHFLHIMEEDQLFDILDARVLEEGRAEEILAIAELARSCLHLNGRRRPVMKEVAMDLEGIQRVLKEDIVSVQHHDRSIDNHSVEPSNESSDFSSISSSMYVGTPTAYS